MNIEPLPSYSPTTHYSLDDGRYWDITAAEFVASLPEGAVCASCGDIDTLVYNLDFFKFSKGELKTDAEYASEARAERDRLLAETDFLMMPDYPLDEERKAAVLAYRQALRDVPEQAGFPRQIDWPVKP